MFGKRKILLIDDETEFADMIGMRLEANNYEVVTAGEGAEGLEKAGSERPDLILLDVMMPGMDGFEVLRRLRGDDRTKRIPVVMLTAKRESKYLFKSDQLGAVDYLMKPCDSKDLLEVVKKHA